MHVYVGFNPISGTYSGINQGRLTGEINIPQISVTKLFAYITAQCNQQEGLCPHTVILKIWVLPFYDAAIFLNDYLLIF